jgi:ACS family glucarate transporter-like MFS transporter
LIFMNASPDVRTLEEGLAPKASRARYGVIAFAASVAALTYIDRVCISKAEPFITKEFRLTPEQMGYVFAAFGVGYALFEVPGGWLGDRIGARKVLTRIVLWWSFFTAATGWAWNFSSLMVTRFLFGVGEAGCFPNVARALKTWLPENERVRAQSIVWLSARWGGAFTPFLIAFLLDVMPWRAILYVFGALGIVWSVLFFRRYRDHPRDLKGANQAERALIEGAAGTSAQDAGPTPWKAMAASRTVWLLCLQYLCLAYAWIFYVTWLPKYLVDVLKVDGKWGAFLNTFPLVLGGIGCIVSGAVLSAVVRWTGNVRLGRRIVGCIGFGAASLLLLLSFYLKNPLWAMVAMGFASFANDFVMPVSWAAAMDVGGRHTGTLSGVMNMASAVGGSAAPILTGRLLGIHGGWELNFWVSAVVYLLGLCCWLFIDPVTPLGKDADPKPEGGLA